MGKERPFVTVAIVAGASSGLGCAYARSIPELFPQVDEIWLVARREEALREVGAGLGVPFRVLALDMARQGTGALAQLLEETRPIREQRGRLGDFDAMPGEDMGPMIRLNCEALTLWARAALPYMGKGSFILNTCSIAAFVPNPRMALYSATKAFVFSLSKALRYELKGQGINVLAACPGPMDTNFLEAAGIPGNSKTFEWLPGAERWPGPCGGGPGAGCPYPAPAVRCTGAGNWLPHNWLMPLSNAEPGSMPGWKRGRRGRLVC